MSLAHATDAPASGLWVGTTCRQCGGVLAEVQPGRSDGVRSTWVGKCSTCRREYAVIAEMVALRDPSLTDRKHATRATA